MFERPTWRFAKTYAKYFRMTFGCFIRSPGRNRFTALLFKCLLPPGVWYFTI